MNNYDELKKEILDKAKVYDIVSSYGIPVEKKGNNYWAVCPFHEDHNPSMSMPVDGKIYTCFVCHAHGNAFNFVMDYENVSFMESMRILANKLGINNNIKITKKITNNNKLYDIYKYSSKYYANKLNSAEGEDALDYLYKRGFTDDIISEFGVGLSTKNGLNKVLKSAGYKDEDIIKSHICNENETGLYDMFTNRIMFPLWDLDGNVVGFSGRIYKDSNKDESKYVNSSSSDIFIKGDILYNYHRAKDKARMANTIIVVEGFMDVIALYKVGIYNVIAGMGTAITPNQAKLIKRMAGNVILMFDGDSAGDKATKACIEVLDGIGVIPKIVRLPNNMDPDEYIKEYGIDKLKEYLDNPKTVLEYSINSYKKETDLSNSESISQYVKNVSKTLSNIDDKVVRELEINKLSEETGVSTSTIKSLISKKKVVTKKIVSTEKLNKYDKAERSLIYYMIRSPEVIKLYLNNKCLIPTQEFRYLVSEIVHYYEKNRSLDSASFLAYLGDNKELTDAFNLIDTLELPISYTYDQIMDYIDILNNKMVEEQKKKLMTRFKLETDEEERLKIAEEISKLRCE